ncbi:MAG: DUF1844 domain-containing protein [Leifsonia xyli]|nr:MAG: DUF1844 domain-containing protein [Leifsonia xyli]
MNAEQSSVVDPEDVAEEIRDIADVPAVEVINTVAVHLLSAAAVKVGLADDPEAQLDLDEARKLIDALAGLVTASAPSLGDHHARALRDGLRTVQLAFRLRRTAIESTRDAMSSSAAQRA